jgi:hypothetical protein
MNRAISMLVNIGAKFWEAPCKVEFQKNGVLDRQIVIAISGIITVSPASPLFLFHIFKRVKALTKQNGTFT